MPRRQRFLRFAVIEESFAILLENKPKKRYNHCIRQVYREKRRFADSLQNLVYNRGRYK